MFAASARSPSCAIGGGSAEADSASKGFDARMQSSAGFSPSWELDAFSRVARQVEAATASLEAIEEDRRDVEVSPFAKAANRYLFV